MTVLDLRIGHESDAGRVRKHNEDYTECFVPTDEAQLFRKGAIFLMADGMGGHLSGEVASYQAVKQVIQHYYLDESPDVGQCLARAFKAANQAVYDMAQADAAKAGMGTTLVAAVVLSQKLYVANVGDSRAYLLRRKRLTQITMDHSWVEEQVQEGTLTREQAEQHPQRNLITRALGTRPSVEVDLFEKDLREGDTLLLCTDGLNNQVSDQEIAQIIRSEPPPEAAAGLVARSNQEGGRDNVSVAIVQVGDRHRGVIWQQIPGLPWLSESRQRQVTVLVGLVILCLCAMIASFPVANQRFVGNPLAAPRPAPVHFRDLHSRDPNQVAQELGYANWADLKVAHPDQVALETQTEATLWPAQQGVFVVGEVQDWDCQGHLCGFSLEMAGTPYAIRLDRGGTPLDLSGRRVRVFAQVETKSLATHAQSIWQARLVDRGATWWAFWQPAWATVYQAHNPNELVWVYSIVDQNPYSPIEVESQPTLAPGDQILLRGRWQAQSLGNPMDFDVASLYRLEGSAYTISLDSPISTP